MLTACRWTPRCVQRFKLHSVTTNLTFINPVSECCERGGINIHVMLPRRKAVDSIWLSDKSNKDECFHINFFEDRDWA